MGWLVGWLKFYGISTLVGYLMPHPLFTYKLNIWFVNEQFIGKIANKQELIYLHTIKWFQVLLSNTNNLIYY